MSDTTTLLIVCRPDGAAGEAGRDAGVMVLRLDLPGAELSWPAIEPEVARLRLPWLADVLRAELGDRPTGGDRSGGAAASRLSTREQEALRYIAAGFTHSQTATRMGVSKATVDTYIDRIRRKLQLGNKAELTRAALGLAPVRRPMPVRAA